MMRVWLLILLAGMAQMPAAPVTHVTGKVVSDTGAPIEHAIVSLTTRAAGTAAAAAPSTSATATAGSPAPAAADGGVGISIRATTDASGAFALDVPARGAYLVDISASGFFTLARQPVSIGDTGAGSGGLRFVLSPIRDFSETVSVSPHASPLDLDQNGSQQTLSGSELLDVPFSGSGVKAGMTTLTGVVMDAYGGIHVNGGPESETVFLLDGFNLSDPLTGTVDPRVTVEAVRSIAVLSGPYSAEYGRGSAGVVDIVTNTGDDRLRYSATDFIPTLGYEKGLRIESWAPRLTVSGPVLPGRAWFTNGLTTEYGTYVVNELPRGADTTSGTRVSDYAHAQVNVAPSNILYASALASVGETDRVGLGPLDPVSTTLDLRGHQWLANIRDQQFLHSDAVLDFGYGSNRTFLRDQPQGHAPYISTPSGRSGNSYIDSEQTSSRDQFLASLSLPTLGGRRSSSGGASAGAGTHQIKTGLDLDRRGYAQQSNRGTLSLLDAAGRPVRTVAFEGSDALSVSAFDAAAYVQDAWRVRPDTLLQLGVRADWNGLVRGWRASPRLGVAWSPFGASAGTNGGGNTKISGGYAVTHDVARLQLFTAPRDQTSVSTFYPPYDTGLQTVRTIFVVPDAGALDVPRTQTWSLTWDQRAPHGLTLRAQALHRRQDHGLAYVGTPHTDRDTIYTLANQRTEAYDAVEVNARQTFRRQYGWMAGYTRSSARSNVLLRVSPDDYFFTEQGAATQGPLAWDAPHRLVSWAYLPTFREPWSIAALLDARTGFPFSVANNAGAIVGPLNGHRFPSYFSLNVDLERRIRFKGNLWALRAGLTNATNHFNPDTVNAIVDSAGFLQFSGGQRRLLEFRIRWLGRLAAATPVSATGPGASAIH
jgi:hypothetical protein